MRVFRCFRSAEDAEMRRPRGSTRWVRSASAVVGWTMEMLARAGLSHSQRSCVLKCSCLCWAAITVIENSQQRKMSHTRGPWWLLPSCIPTLQRTVHNAELLAHTWSLCTPWKVPASLETARQLQDSVSSCLSLSNKVIFCHLAMHPCNAMQWNSWCTMSGFSFPVGSCKRVLWNLHLHVLQQNPNKTLHTLRRALRRRQGVWFCCNTQF